MFNVNVIVGTSLNSLNQNRTFHQVVSTSSSHAGPQHTIQFQPLQSTTTSLITNQSMNPLKRKMEDDYDNPSWWRSGCEGEKINMKIVLINLIWLKSCTLIVYFSASFVRELITQLYRIYSNVSWCLNGVTIIGGFCVQCYDERRIPWDWMFVSYILFSKAVVYSNWDFCIL